MKRKLYMHSNVPCHKNTEFVVLSYNPVTKRGIVKGEYAPFETDLSKETLMKNGWRIDRQSYQEMRDAKQSELRERLQAGESDAEEAWGG